MLTFEESEWKVYENSLYYASTLCISRTWDENHNPGWHLFSPERPWAEGPGVPCLDFRLTHGNCEIINCVSVCVFNSINRRFPRWLSGVTEGWARLSNYHLHFCFITSDCRFIHGMINGWSTGSYLTATTAKNELSLEGPMFFSAELSKFLFFWYLNYNMQLTWLLCQPRYWSEEAYNEQPCSGSKIKPVLL